MSQCCSLHENKEWDKRYCSKIYCCDKCPLRQEDVVNLAAKVLGSKGGLSTSKKYGKEQLKEWGKLGGRPRNRPDVRK